MTKIDMCVLIYAGIINEGEGIGEILRIFNAVYIHCFCKMMSATQWGFYFFEGDLLYLLSSGLYLFPNIWLIILFETRP